LIAVIPTPTEAEAEESASPSFPAVADSFSFHCLSIGRWTPGGHACNVGLLNASPQNQLKCDIHLSHAGQKLIALRIPRWVNESVAMLRQRKNRGVSSTFSGFARLGWP
jgi:hypothetical protein